jgi:plasmid rolling circle replication initiator protein Rep
MRKESQPDPFPITGLEARKKLSQKAVEILSPFAEHHRHAARMKACAELVDIEEQTHPETGEVHPALHSTYRCHVPHCPVCGGYRNALRLRAQIFAAMPHILAEHGNVAFLALYPTIKNCPVTELRATVKALHAAAKLLVKKLPFVKGSLRFVEITRHAAKAHPHLNLVLMVPASYFTNARIRLTHADWRIIWQECLNVNYLPEVEVWEPQKDSLAKALRYAIKPPDTIDIEHTLASPEWYLAFLEQTFRLPFFAADGAFKGILKQKTKPAHYKQNINNIKRFLYNDKEGQYKQIQRELST